MELSLYHKKYLKYKYKYINLSNNNEQTYEFIEDVSDIFFEKYFIDMIKLDNVCFPHNVNNNDNNSIEKIKLFNKKKQQIIKKYFEVSKYFFAMYKEKLIGYCFIYAANVFKYTKKINVYEKIISPDFFEDAAPHQLNYCIYGLCKNFEYKNVGSFILKNVIDYYHKLYINKLGPKIIYIIPGSSYYLNNYESFVNNNYCDIIDNNKFYESNIKLVDYYSKNNFKLSKKYYVIDKCKDSNKIIVYNVMYIKINKL